MICSNGLACGNVACWCAQDGRRSANTAVANVATSAPSCDSSTDQCCVDRLALTRRTSRSKAPCAIGAQKLTVSARRIAGPLWVIDQRPQDGRGGRSAERADEGPVIVAGLPSPAAVTGGNPRGIVEKVLGFGKHRLFRISSFRDGALAPDPESRDSGFDATHRPGMTVSVLHAQYRGNS